MSMAARWDRFVYREYMPTPRGLAIFRLLFASAFLACSVPRYQWIATFPDDFFNPPVGPTYFFFTGFPPYGFFLALDTVIVTALVYLIAGRRVTLASAVFTGAALLGNAWAYSFGKIDHDILMVVMPAFLAAAGWSGKGRVRAWPLALFALVVSLAMFSAALAKATSGWLDPHARQTFIFALRNAIGISGRESAAWRFGITTMPASAWKALDYATLLLEGSFVIAMFRRTTFRVACAVASLFHLGVLLMMKIKFLANIYAYSAFVQWDDVAARCGVAGVVATLQRWLARRSDLQLLVTSIAMTALVILEPHRGIAQIGTTALMWIAAAIGIAYLASFALAWLAPVGRSSVETPDTV